MNTAEIKQAAKRYMQDRYGIKGNALTTEFLNEVLKGVKRRYARPIETEVKAHIEMCMLYGWERGQKCLDDDKMKYIDVVKKISVDNSFKPCIMQIIKQHINLT